MDIIILFLTKMLRHNTYFPCERIKFENRFKCIDSVILAFQLDRRLHNVIRTRGNDMLY